MAQITRHAIGAALLLSLTAMAGAQTIVPDAAIVAEAAGKWDDAIAVYRRALDVDARRVDLWVRLADVEARRANSAGVIDALQHASRLAPRDARMYERLSQAYAVAGQPRAGLEAIQAAVELEPNSVDYLRARATLATWAGDYKRARDSYQRLAARLPLDDSLVLAYARVSAWSGDTNGSVTQYERYLAEHADAAEIWLELARAESWRGNYPAAVRALGTYLLKFGVSDAYDRELMAVMTGAGRPRLAEGMADQFLARTPDSYQVNLTRAVALAMQQRSKEAFTALGTARSLAPEYGEVRNAERVLRTLLSSTIDPQLTVYQDSDRLQTMRIAPRATVSFDTGTQFSAGYDRTSLSARAGSGLEQIGGGTTAMFERTWLVAAQNIGALTVRGGAGYATSGVDHLITSLAGAEVRAGDTLRFSAEREFGYLTISPRAASLGLTQVAYRSAIDWMPTLRDRVAVDALYQELSDGNRRWELTVTPRHSVARTTRFNLDIGVSAYRLETAQDLDHGYYDPRRYEQYSAVLFPYFKFRENVGLSLSGGFGVQRDIATPGFQPGGTVGGEATFGIYEPWVLKVSSSATMNRRLESGGFRGISGSVSIVRRF
jgi:tetratricopeptide (TPR) repeat protein